MQRNGLEGALVLVVEDEWLVAEETVRVLQRAGCRVLGPAPSVAAALDLLESETPDVALLDAGLGDQMSFAVADILLEHGVPFAFLSGRSSGELPVGYKGYRFLRKPISDAMLRNEVLGLLNAA